MDNAGDVLRLASIDLDSVRALLTDAATRERLWRYVLFRETPRLGATDFVFFVRRDLAGPP